MNDASVSRLLDERACERVLIRLFQGLDTRDYEGVARCFTDDGLWLRQGKELRGPAEVLKALHLRTATIHVHHILGSIDVRLTGAAAAKCSAYMLVYRSDTGRPPQFPIHAAGPELVAACTADMRRVGEDWRVSRLANDVTYSST